MATLFVQSSAEFYANSKSIYAAAQSNLKELLQDQNHTAALEQKDNYQNKPPAIILDVDQTVLDNSAYQARLIKNNTSYPDGWVSWAKEDITNPVNKSYFIPFEGNKANWDARKLVIFEKDKDKLPTYDQSYFSKVYLIGKSLSLS